MPNYATRIIISKPTRLRPGRSVVIFSEDYRLYEPGEAFNAPHSPPDIVVVASVKSSYIVIIAESSNRAVYSLDGDVCYNTYSLGDV